MREIKFRAWDGIRMSNSGIMFNTSTGHLDIPKVQDMYLMQTAGIKDKNGTDNYEGDILLWSDGYKQNEFKDEAIFENGRFRGKKTGGFDPFDSGGATTFYCKVIGNIYKNPELLKAK